MAKIKDIAGGFFNNDTIYSPNGFTQARKVSDAIIDRTISDMSDEISQGMNFGAQHKRKGDGKASIAELTGNKEKSTVSSSPLPGKKALAEKKKNQKSEHKAGLKKSRDFAFKQAEVLEQEADSIEQEADSIEQEADSIENEDEKKELLEQAKSYKAEAKSYRAEAERMRKDAETTYKSNTKKETIVSPDTVSSGATAEPIDDKAPGTKEDPTAVRGRRADEPAPKPNLPQARSGLYEEQSKAKETLTNKRSERDEFIESARQDKKSTKRNMREKSIVPDDFDFDDEFDSTDPFIASLFQKGKINKLLKDQIKEKYPDKITEITERVKNDPDNADLSGRELRKLINAEVKNFVEPLWKNAGGDTQVNKIGLITPVAATIKKMMSGSAHESVTKVMNDKRAALEKKQNRSLKDQMFLDAFNMIEKDISTAEGTAKLKGEVKDARSNLTNLNAEVREHEKDVESARNEFYKGGRKSRTEYDNGWYFTHTSGDGRATQYASRIEERDGKKMFVTYSVTAGSPNTNRDPVYIAEYKDYQGERDPNVQMVENFAEARLDQVEGGFKNQAAAIRKAQSEKDFEALDGQNYFEYREAHKIMAPKIVKLISDLGGKIDAETGKIYTTSVAEFPEGANELRLGYKEAKHLAGKSDEDVAKLTGMTPEEVKARQITGMMRDFKLGDANVIEDEQGRTVYQLPDQNMTTLSGANGRTLYINWNEPHNRKVVAEYAKRGIDKRGIPTKELKIVNMSRSTEGNIDWSDKKKTKAAERAQRAKYTGTYKPSADILDALIGFGNKSK